MSLYRTDDDPRFKFGDVVHIRNPHGSALPVLVPRAMTYSEAREYGAWFLTSGVLELDGYRVIAAERLIGVVRFDDRHVLVLHYRK